MTALPHYRDLVWRVTREADDPEVLVLSWVDDEARLLDPAERAKPSNAASFPLPSFMERDQLRRWHREGVSAAEASAVGRMLWHALPPEATAAIGADSGEVTRIKLTTAARRAGDFPWEWLTRGDEAIALSPSLRFSRVLATRLPVPPLSVDPPLRVLMVATNPTDKRVLELDRELDAIAGALVPPHYDVHVLDRPSIVELRRLLAEEPPHIIHYVGHGGLNQAEGTLILGDANGQSVWVSGERVAEELPSCVRLLCLSACFTARNFEPLGLPRLARSASSGHLPTTVTNQYPVGEAAVRAFWTAFYEHLVVDGNVNESVHDGRHAVADATPDSADWASFTYVVRDQTGVSFDLHNVATAASRQPAEVQAQFAAQFVNELAEQLSLLGPSVPPTLRRHFEEQMDSAVALIDEAMREERS